MTAAMCCWCDCLPCPPSLPSPMCCCINLLSPDTVATQLDTTKYCFSTNIKLELKGCVLLGRLDSKLLEMRFTHCFQSFSSRSLEPSFSWSGPCSRNFQLEPLSSQTIILYASFSFSGVYCISTMKVKAAQVGAAALERQQWYQPCYINIGRL